MSAMSAHSSLPIIYVRMYYINNNMNVYISSIVRLYSPCVCVCVVVVGCYHRDGRAEQTHTHLPSLPRNGAKPEQLASLWVDPAAGCTEGLDDFLN